MLYWERERERERAGEIKKSVNIKKEETETNWGGGGGGREFNSRGLKSLFVYFSVIFFLIFVRENRSI